MTYIQIPVGLDKTLAFKRLVAAMGGSEQNALWVIFSLASQILLEKDPNILDSIGSDELAAITGLSEEACGRAIVVVKSGPDGEFLFWDQTVGPLMRRRDHDRKRKAVQRNPADAAGSPQPVPKSPDIEKTRLEKTRPEKTKERERGSPRPARFLPEKYQEWTSVQEHRNGGSTSFVDAAIKASWSINAAVEQWEKFRRWEFKTAKSDWLAAWRNWLDRADKPGGKSNISQQAISLIQQLKEEDDRDAQQGRNRDGLNDGAGSSGS